MKQQGRPPLHPVASPPIALASVALALVLALTGACQSSSGTSILVTIDVDQSLVQGAVNDVHAELSSSGRADLVKDLPARSTQLWQINVASAAAAFQALVVVTGRQALDAGTVTNVVTAARYVTVVPGKQSDVTITLSASCAGPSAPVCTAMETCSSGACIPIPGAAGDGGLGDARGDAQASDRSAGRDAGVDRNERPDVHVAVDGGCSGDAGCGAGSMCDPGTQTCKPKLAPGAACTTTEQCASGLCSSADHVCCNSDCAGTCESCIASKTGGTDGTCTPLPSGSNADSDCTPSSSACGATGFCDGKGACALAGVGTTCPGSSMCASGQLTITPASCNGAGSCMTGTATTGACPGGVACMNATTCLPAACTVDGNCATGSFCNTTTSTCAPKGAVGAQCAGNNQCSGGACADGVCCTNACQGTCEACVMTKTGVADGHCAAVTTNTDPDNECSSDGTTCGRTGLCDHNGGNGGGACAYTASGTTCAGTSSCSGSGTTSTTTGACDGKGSCGQSSPVAGSCGGYSCASTTACGTSCTATAGCVSGYVCSAGSCVAHAFTTGPCVTTADDTTAVVFGAGNDVKIHQISNNGTAWGSWVSLSLDATVLDARSDLDCSANGDVTHLVATGSNPLGAFMHATGSGTAFNAFFREFPTETFSPGASIKAYPAGNNYVMGALDVNAVFDDVYSGVATAISPITTRVNPFASSDIDVSQQVGGGSSLRLVAAFDDTGLLQIYGNYVSSAPAMWVAPVTLQPPSGTTFSYSPTICVDTGEMGGIQIHVAAVAGGQVWESYTTDFGGGVFSAWQRIATQGASAPDCTMMGDESVHVVLLSSAGHVLDIHGSPGSWTTSDLGAF